MTGHSLSACLLAALAVCACSPGEKETSPTTPETSPLAPPGVGETVSERGSPTQNAPNVMGVIPAGDYTLDPSHSSLVFKVSHLGFSTFVGTFDTFDAKLSVDPENPSVSELTATVQLASLDIPTPPSGFIDELLGPDWLNAGASPVMTFKSTRVAPQGQYAARVTGDLTFNQTTAPVSMDVVFNGGWEGIPPDPHARIGFSASGSLNRSDFGVSNGVPEPGTTMGVSDTVEFRIETEFAGPEWEQPPADGAETGPGE